MPIYNRGKSGVTVSGQRLLLDRAVLDPTRSGPRLFEDFLLDAVAEDTYLVSQSGTPSTAAALTAAAGAPIAGHGGWLAGSVDNVDGEIDEVALGHTGGLGWMIPAALGTGEIMVCEIALVIPAALTARMYFAGFGDAATGGADDDGMISIPSAGVTLVSGATGDAVGFVFSSVATDADAWYTGAVKATTVGTAYNTTTGTQGATANPGVVDDYTKLRVEVDSVGNSYFYLNVSPAGQREIVPQFVQTQQAAVTTTAAFLPIFQAASTTTTAVEWELDYLFGGSSR